MSESIDYQQLAEKIKAWGEELGFQQVGIADLDLSKHEAALQDWLDKQYHGDMDYMERHGMLRARPAELSTPVGLRAISVRWTNSPKKAKFGSVLRQNKESRLM